MQIRSRKYKKEGRSGGRGPVSTCPGEDQLVLARVSQRLRGDKGTLALPLPAEIQRVSDFSSQARSYNKQMRPAILDHCSGNKWTNTSHQPEYLVGEEVRNLDNERNGNKTTDSPEFAVVS